MRNSLVIIILFICGAIGGAYRLLPEILLQTDLSTYALYILIFFVGINIGADTRAWQVIKTVKWKIVLVPFSVIIGTFTGVAIISLFMNTLSTQAALTVGAGFGYYSLSSIIISEMGNHTLGTIALFSNILREIITLLASPLLAKFFGKLAPIASGGATSMDTTLPIITQSAGKEYAIISLFSGIVLTILVPFIVTLIMQI